jgi:hypothetical protein
VTNLNIASEKLAEAQAKGNVTGIIQLQQVRNVVVIWATILFVRAA